MSDVQQLADAAIAGDIDTVRRLLGEDASLSSEHTEEGWTVLHLAATAEIAANEVRSPLTFVSYQLE